MHCPFDFYSDALDIIFSNLKEGMENLDLASHGFFKKMVDMVHGMFKTAINKQKESMI